MNIFTWSSTPKPKLPGRDDRMYWSIVREWAETSGSDGCTHALELRVSACHEHDYHCVYHETMYGARITSAQAAWRFRQVLAWQSSVGVFSPMSWWRWAAVRLFGPQWR